jgi:hypothetical protein
MKQKKITFFSTESLNFPTQVPISQLTGALIQTPVAKSDVLNGELFATLDAQQQQHHQLVSSITIEQGRDSPIFLKNFYLFSIFFLNRF